MLVFVDESGDTGRKIGQGSSQFFVVALVIFKDDYVAAACSDAIDRVREELGLGLRFEFHFAKNNHRIREAFLEAVSHYRFRFHAFALNKDPNELYGDGFYNPSSLYKFAARIAFENALKQLDQAKVRFDKSGNRKFQKELKGYLNRRVNQRSGRQPIYRIASKESHGDNLLQLADYVAGVSNRMITGKKGGAELHRAYLQSKEIRTRVWP